jgi:hypothetical protein
VVVLRRTVSEDYAKITLKASHLDVRKTRYQQRFLVIACAYEGVESSLPEPVQSLGCACPLGTAFRDADCSGAFISRLVWEMIRK